MLRKTQGGWMMKRTWRGFLNLSVEERVYLTAEIMRAHRCVPNQTAVCRFPMKAIIMPSSWTPVVPAVECGAEIRWTAHHLDKGNPTILVLPSKPMIGLGASPTYPTIAYIA